MKTLDRINQFINKVLMYIAGAALVAMLFVGFGNMFFRSVWMPIRGSYEIIGFLGALTAALPLGLTQIRKSHIAVDIIADRYPRWLQHLVEGVSCFLCMIFFILVAWKTFQWGLVVKRSGEVSETLGIPYYPIVYAVSVGFLVLSFSLLVDTIKSFKSMKEER